MPAVPVWCLILMGLELALAGSLSPGEVAVAAGTGLAGALLARAAVRAFDPPWRAPGFVRALWVLPVDIALDSARLVGQVLTRRDAGRERALTVPEDSRGTDERLAYAVLLASVSPGTFVVSVSDDETTLELHSRVPDGRIEGELRDGKRGPS